MASTNISKVDFYEGLDIAQERLEKQIKEWRFDVIHDSMKINNHLECERVFVKLGWRKPRYEDFKMTEARLNSAEWCLAAWVLSLDRREEMHFGKKKKKLAQLKALGEAAESIVSITDGDAKFLGY